MKHPTNPDAELRAVIARGGAVVVAGTGVSMAASRDPSTGKPHPEASWAGLLENGLDWLQQHSHMATDEAAAHLTLLKKRGDTHHFISAAEDVTRLMGGVESKHFAEWLTRTIGSIKAHDRKCLDALETLREQGNVLATTNYDGLLLDDAGLLKPVTWKEPDAFLRAARNKETDRIIFLHGYWRQPQSVILDWNSYQEIARDDRYREELAAVWKMTTWLYVGCGVNGLNDPDFGLLLERYGEYARNADLWDFCLVRKSQREEFQAHFDKLQVNICAVSFGDSHDDLPQYLGSLLPPTTPTTAAAVPVVPPTAAPITEFLRVTDTFFQYRASDVAAAGVAAANRGDFRFTAEEFRSGAVHRAQVVEVVLNRLRRDDIVWMEGPSAGGKTTVCLHLVSEWKHLGCEPLYLDLADEPDAEQAVREITAHAKAGRMFILDNVHDAPKVACALLDHWKAQRRDSVMVLLGWPAAVRPGHDYLSGHRHSIVPVAVQPEDWIGVYQSTFRFVRGSGHVPPVPPAQVVKAWDDTFAANLVTFQYALSAGLRLGGGNAFQIEQAAADRYVREKYLDECSDQERRDLFLLAWLAELGRPLAEEAASSAFKHSLACGLIRQTYHGRYKDYVRYQPWHRSFARLLLGLAPQSYRTTSLCAAAAAHPFSVGILTHRLLQHGERRLAEEIFTHALNDHPSLADWLGTSVMGGATLFKHARNLIPKSWTAIALQLSQPEELNKLTIDAFGTQLADLAHFLRFAGQTDGLQSVHAALCRALATDAALPADQSRLQAQAFATPLHFLVTFLRFAGQTDGLQSVHAALCRALATDAALPADQSRLQAQAFANPLGDLVTFLRFAGQTDGLQSVHAALCQALATDAALPADQSRLQAQAFATPLHFLVTFLRFAGQTDGLQSVHAALCRALATDAALPADQSRLQAQAFANPLLFLVAFLQFAAQTDGLQSVHAALCRALATDAALPADQSRLQAQAFGTQLGHLVPFLRFVAQTDGLQSVHAALCRALATDAALPADQSRLQAQAFANPLGDLVTFLRFAGQTDGLQPVHAALCQALATDAALPADQSRLQAQGFANPLHLVATFLRFAAQTDGLQSVHAALCRALATDAALPADQSRLQAQAFATPLHLVATFLQFAAQTDGLQSVHAALCRALATDAALPADQSRLQAQAFANPLGDLVTFLRFAGQTDGLQPVHAALCQALAADAALPADQSRLLGIARTTKDSNLRGFVIGAKAIPELAAVADVIERDTACAQVLQISTNITPLRPPVIFYPSPRSVAVVERTLTTPLPPLQLRSQLDDRIQAGIERVLNGAWEDIPLDLTAEDQFKLARQKASQIISRLSPHIKRQVGAHFETQKWEPLKPAPRSRDGLI